MSSETIPALNRIIQSLTGISGAAGFHLTLD